MRAPLVVAALALVAASAPRLTAQTPAATAQEAKAPKREKGIPDHFDGITLTEEQKTSIRSLHHDFHTQMTALKVTSKQKDNDGRTVPMTDKVKKQLADLEAKEMAAFRAILTPDQQGAFDKHLAKEKEEEAKKAAAASPAKP